jgi:mono/diheme cytochrome c family protein
LAVAIFAFASWAALCWGLCAVQAAPPEPDAVKFFETSVRPILAENCFKCHGQTKQKGGLRLDSPDRILQGGESGPAIVRGKAAESLLIEAINHEGLEMPPNGKLKEDQRAILRKWIELGAPMPEAGHGGGIKPTVGPSKIRTLTAEDREFWCFQPVRRPEEPEVANPEWSRNPIDRFIAARLVAEGLSPAPEADRRTLIRRAAFDLLGLPPTPAQVEAFVHDPAPDAYERLIDRYLASPQYGERWGRHWLDLVRYAESDGYRADGYRSEAWRYRDYVIGAFNADRPYTEFIADQLAGDELAPGDIERAVATGYYRLGAYEHNQTDVRGQWTTMLNEITDVTTEVFLGLSVGCARCHDHKFDPILQKDYYRFRAFFTPLFWRDDLLVVTPEEQRKYEDALEAWEAKIYTIRQEIEEIEKPYREISSYKSLQRLPKDIEDMILKPASQRTPLEHQLAELAMGQYLAGIDGAFKTPISDRAKKKRWDELHKQLKAFEREKPVSPPCARAATDVGPNAPPTFIPTARKPQDIKPGFLSLLDPTPAKITRPYVATNSTGRRSALVRWLTRADNPLTPRVMVNRIWQYHFGRGLVKTSSDFGRLGERPSHPELLDWLASYYMAQGWHLKPLHKLIMTSAAYRQSAQAGASETASLKDPENRLVWHMSNRRLEAEPIRDAMLAVSGELDPRGGGPPSEPDQPRRAVYTKVKRNTHDPLLDALDAPDGSISMSARNVTTTPTQALVMINGPWLRDRARAFAGRLRREAADNPARITLAYTLAFGRPPEPPERDEALTFLEDQAQKITKTPLDEAALVDFCHALLNANEFLYVD